MYLIDYQTSSSSPCGTNAYDQTNQMCYSSQAMMIFEDAAVTCNEESGQIFQFFYTDMLVEFGNQIRTSSALASIKNGEPFWTDYQRDGHGNFSNDLGTADNETAAGTLTVEDYTFATGDCMQMRYIASTKKFVASAVDCTADLRTICMTPPETVTDCSGT